jgi:hypothetical protein
MLDYQFYSKPINQNMKPIIQRLPELFFMGLGMYWVTENYLASGHINWIAIVFIVMLSLQLIFQQRIAGMALGLVLGLICAYMMFAVLSEFYEFKAATREALQLLGFGLGVFGVGVVSATAMVYKFALGQHDYMKNKQPLTA